MQHDVPDPIDDDEILYRRVPAAAAPQRYDPDTGELTDQAFAPHRTEDVTGISLVREKFKNAEQAARGRAGKSYYVAALRAGDIRCAGMSVEPRPHLSCGIDPAHAELPDLNSGNRKDDATLERQRVLVRLCLRVLGPFDAPAD